MAVLATRVTAVDSEARVLVDGNDLDGAQAVVKNVTGTATVYLGPPGVTSATGFAWAPADGPLTVSLKSGEVLSCRLASSDAAQTLHALASSE